MNEKIQIALLTFCGSFLGYKYGKTKNKDKIESLLIGSFIGTTIGHYFNEKDKEEEQIKS